MTREEKIELLEKEKAYMIGHGGDRQATALDSAIKALEQESVLDQIRAEIEALPKTYPFVNHIDMYVKVSDVGKIIDKYKAKTESEERKA